MAIKKRAVDITKKTNIKCENCKYWQSWAWIRLNGKYNRCAKCGKGGEVKKSYNRCKEFQRSNELL